MDYDAIRNAFLSDQSKLATMEKLENLLSREVTETEVSNIVSLMAGQEYQFFRRHKTIGDAQDAIASHLSRIIIKVKSKRKIISRNYADEAYSSDEAERSDPDEPIQDLLKNEIYSTSETNATRTRLDLDWGAQKYQKKVDFDKLPQTACRSFMGWQDGYDLVNAINPMALVRTFPPLTLDTRNRVLVDVDPGTRNTMQWNFYNNSRWEQGGVNGLGTIRDIVGIECGTIYFPNTEDQAFTEYRQITMFIHEFSEQSSILSDKVRYHFLFNAEAITDDSGTERLKLVPAFRDAAETRFDRPITTLNTITISFGCPGERISFGHDRDLNPAINAANPAVITTSVNHGMSNGDLVYLEGFTADNPEALGTLLDIANKEKGHVIQSVTVNTFEIAELNTSSATNPVVYRIVFGSRRFFIPLKFRYMGGKRYDDEGY